MGAVRIRLRLAIHRVRSAGSSGTPTTAAEHLHRRRDEHCSSACKFICAGRLRTTDGRPYDGSKSKSPRIHSVPAGIRQRGAEGVAPCDNDPAQPFERRKAGYASARLWDDADGKRRAQATRPTANFNHLRIRRKPEIMMSRHAKVRIGFFLFYLRNIIMVN